MPEIAPDEVQTVVKIELDGEANFDTSRVTADADAFAKLSP